MFIQDPSLSETTMNTPVTTCTRPSGQRPISANNHLILGVKGFIISITACFLPLLDSLYFLLISDKLMAQVCWSSKCFRSTGRVDSSTALFQPIHTHTQNQTYRLKLTQTFVCTTIMSHADTHRFQVVRCSRGCWELGLMAYCMSQGLRRELLWAIFTWVNWQVITTSMRDKPERCHAQPDRSWTPVHVLRTSKNAFKPATRGQQWALLPSSSRVVDRVGRWV